MSAAICPYCRAAIEPDDEQAVCPGCGTPHHADCFEENGGCTVFGCTAAPPAEPKLSIGAPDLYQVGMTTAAPPAPFAPVAPPPLPGSTGAPPPPLPGPPVPSAPEAPPLFSSLGYGPPRATPFPAPAPRYAFPPPEWAIDPALPRKNRTTYLLLGVLLGGFGAHSFYSGSIKKGCVQLGITLLTFGIAGFMVWIWAIIDICTITTDHDGIPFRN